MQNCLGIYVENNLIKYAKVAKDREEIKIESFGIKFFDNLTEGISKVVEETYSFSTPISINLEGEKYLYFDVFSLLNKNDIKKTIQTEFETYCDDKKYNANAFETRYALVKSVEDKEKIKAIFIHANKIEMNNRLPYFGKYKLRTITPIGMSIANIADLKEKENALIVNMEETTTVTMMIDKQVYNVDLLDFGSGEVLDRINKNENSYSKAYDICKNTTIYTAEVKSLVEEQDYLEYIVPTLYRINEKIQEIMQSMPTVKFDKVYFTGTLALINNVDLYFQEYIRNAKCEILKPYFIRESVAKINIKDYIEVNSAISLGLQGLNEGVQGINFKTNSQLQVALEKLNIDVSKKSNEKTGKKLVNIDFKLGGPLDFKDAMLIRASTAVLLFVIIYSIFAITLGKQMKEKEEEVLQLTANQRAEISKIDYDAQVIKNKTTEYQTMISEIETLNNKMSDKASFKNSIPNLLNQIMNTIPSGVRLTSITNDVDRHVKIVANANEYDELGYLIAKLKTGGILKNVISSSGVRNDKVVTVTIEGDLP